MIQEKKPRKQLKRIVRPITLQFEKGTIQILVPERGIRQFEKNHGAGSMARILQDLTRSCTSFADIARQYGLSRERPRQIYGKYLAEYLPHKDGWERSRFCTITRPHRKTWSETTMMVWREARKIGLNVTFVNRKLSCGPVYTLGSYLLINGHLCRIKVSRTIFDIGAQQYFRFSFGKIDTQFFILVTLSPVSLPSFFIIPVKEIQSVAARTKGGMIYIPIDGYSTRKVKCNWRSFKDAWHLLN